MGLQALKNGFEGIFKKILPSAKNAGKKIIKSVAKYAGGGISKEASSAVSAQGIATVLGPGRQAKELMKAVNSGNAKSAYKEISNAYRAAGVEMPARKGNTTMEHLKNWITYLREHRLREMALKGNAAKAEAKAAGELLVPVSKETTQAAINAAASAGEVSGVGVFKEARTLLKSVKNAKNPSELKAAYISIKAAYKEAGVAMPKVEGATIQERMKKLITFLRDHKNTQWRLENITTPEAVSREAALVKAPKPTAGSAKAGSKKAAKVAKKPHKPVDTRHILDEASAKAELRKTAMTEEVYGAHSSSKYQGPLYVQEGFGPTYPTNPKGLGRYEVRSERRNPWGARETWGTDRYYTTHVGPNVKNLHEKTTLSGTTEPVSGVRSARSIEYYDGATGRNSKTHFGGDGNPFMHEASGMKGGRYVRTVITENGIAKLDGNGRVIDFIPAKK